MLYDAKISMRLPGDSAADAERRLASKLPPGWTFHIDAIEPALEQPPRVTGTLNIKLPGVATHGR
jgi:hypothetical protein